jgi:hypothetical protein
MFKAYQGEEFKLPLVGQMAPDGSEMARDSESRCLDALRSVRDPIVDRDVVARSTSRT